MNTFEQSLLTELREHVAARTPAPRSRRPRRLIWLAVPAAVGATALAVGLIGLPGTEVGQPAPAVAAAYTVNRNAEDVVITVTRLEDADGLEDALAAAGIEAEVEYGGREERLAGVEIYPLSDHVPEAPGPGEVPSGPGATPLRASGKAEKPRRLSAVAPVTPAAPVTPPSDGMTVSAQGTSVTIRIQRDAVPDGKILRIVATGALDLGLASFGVGWVPAG